MNSEIDAETEGTENQFPDDTEIAHLRAEILARFEVWLDAALAAETPPEGIDGDLLTRLMSDDEEQTAEAEAAMDTYSLWASVIAVTQEVKLQGRAFTRLTESLTPMTESVAESTRWAPELLARQEDLAEHVRSMRADALERARGELLEVLIDLRDRQTRLESGVAAVIAAAEEADRPALLLGFLPVSRPSSPDLLKSLQGLADGMRLISERLRDQLAALGISEIPGLGHPFDPVSMRAVEIARDPDVKSDMVVEVYRRGYRMGNRVYRLADVKVNRRDEVPGKAEVD